MGAGDRLLAGESTIRTLIVSKRDSEDMQIPRNPSLDSEQNAGAVSTLSAGHVTCTESEKLHNISCEEYTN